MMQKFCRTCSRTGLHTHKHALIKPQPQEPDSRYRLPRTVVPKHYDLSIIPGPDTLRFTGNVTIAVDLRESTSVVTVNAKALTIDRAAIADGTGREFVGTVSYDADAETAQIDFDGCLDAGSWALTMSFAGVHGANGQGFFASKWQGEDKVEHTVLCTQFEAADARSAFPCFDEPAFKATFKARLIVDKSLTALANGDIVGESEYELDATKKVVEFEETLKISTYVVAFVVGPFVGSEPVVVAGKRLRIWCMPGEEHLTGFGLRVAGAGLTYFERYFDLPYPFGNKIDLVSVPGFAWGGMENVGLIVFQKSLLLVEEDGSVESKNQVANIINHELAHQWFGDLVTMLWWNGLWLNESFATFMQYKATDAFEPAWRQWENFGPKRNSAYWVDALRSSHPIEESVEHARDAILLVDNISYEKGCAVLYQTEQFIGEEVVRQGISAYLKKHAFGNTESADLWVCLEKACAVAGLDLPVREMMEAWIYQVGHPEVMVNPGKKPGQIELSQRQFLLLERGRKNGKRWPVPLHIEIKGVDGKVQDLHLLFDRSRHTLFVGAYDWIKVNAGGSGFYRVRYAAPLLDRLTHDGERLEQLLPIERWNILSDARAFFNACIIDAPTYLSILMRFVRCRDATTWSALISGFGDVSALCERRERAKLQRLVACSIKQVAEQQGWIVDGKLVSASMPFVGEMRPYHLNLNPSVQKLSRIFYKQWSKDKGAVPEMVAAQASMVLCFAGSRISRAFYDISTPSHYANGAQVLDYLQALVDAHGKLGLEVDIYALLASVLTYEGWGSEGVVSKLEEDWAAMLAGPTPPIALLYKVRYGPQGVDTPELEKRLIRLFKKHPSALARNEIRRALERVRANVIMRERQSEPLKAFLSGKPSI
ncbi:MAG: M1 family metallopeptidase [Candidatus Obscuribacter sp.]|nr:M1 family metallopeptidase [Candidatus Obscuribacter sp.]MBP6592465.1 M1 family metallopeptidase [Candidatus Obscuribacter sp.]